MSITLNEQAMQDILLGATFLGSGGGGPKSVGRQIIAQILKYPQLPVLMEANEVPNDALMALSAFVGSPDASSGVDLDYGKVAKTAYDALDEVVNPRKAFTHIIGAEPGAGSSFIPMAVAALNNIPIADATAAPRAVPTIPLGTFAAANLPVSPIVLANPEHHMMLRVENADQADPAIRGVISNNPAFGSIGGVALWAMNGSQMKHTGILGTFKRAMELGAVIRAAEKSPDPVSTMLKATGGYLLGKGTLQSVSATTTGGFDFLTVVVALENGKDQLYVYGQNENIFAFNTGKSAPIAMGPDSLCWMLTTGEPFSNAEASHLLNKSVALIGLPAPAAFRVPFIVEHFQVVMRQLGYAGPYTPVEQLNR